MYRLADISLFESVVVYNERTVDEEGNRYRTLDEPYDSQATGTIDLIPDVEVEDLLDQAVSLCGAACRSMDALERRDSKGVFFSKTQVQLCYNQLSTLYNALMSLADGNRRSFGDKWDN